MDLHQEVAHARESLDISGLIAKIPYARFLGVECLAIGEEMLFKLPVNEQNQGNPFLPAIHGGVTGGFMELSATLYVLMNLEVSSLPKVVDFSIDYLRPGRMVDTYVTCEVVRQGRKIVNVSVVAWQGKKNAPIATARLHFLLK